MKGLDTNVLVRYFTQDDPEQSERASAFIEEAIRAGEQCAVSQVVLCELVWVLRSAYDYDKPVILELLQKILETRQFHVEDADLASGALSAFRATRADFADCIIGLRNQSEGCERTATFDRGLLESALFEVL